MTLKIPQTTCRFRKFINIIEKHGDDDVTAFGIPFDVELTASMLNSLTEDKLFHKRVYDSADGRGRPVSIGEGFTKFKPLVFRDHFEDCIVEFEMDNKKLHYEGRKVSKIVLDLQLGGKTHMSGLINVRPETDREICLLLHYQRREVLIAISGGKLVESDAQEELELGGGEETVDGKDDDGNVVSLNGSHVARGDQAPTEG